MDQLFILLRYLFLGIVQGITETLPISSSGHLVIVHELLNLQDNSFTLSILLHIASLIAIIVFFRKTLYQLVKNFFLFIFKKERKPYKSDFIYVWLLVIGSIPAGIIGILFKNQIEAKLTNLLTVGMGLLFTSLILLFISRRNKNENVKANPTMWDAIIIGIMQAIAIIPGISRSGSTVSAGLFRKLKTEQALNFAFLLFIPATLGAAILEVKDVLSEVVDSTLFIPYLISFLAATLFTYLSLYVFFGIMKKGKLGYFSIYCSLMGITSIILWFTL